MLAPARLAALALALACLGLPWLLRRRWGPKAIQAIAPALAATLSALYVVVYLRGGPRIIDAAAYFLEASVFADGQWTLPLRGPEHATLGRFLLRTPAGEAAVIFPPGYPAVLALGFWLGAPLAIGPALAAGLTAATMALTRQVLLERAPSPDAPASESLVAGVGLLSATCAALRYHTADTMSHGLAALLVVTTLTAGLRLRATPKARLPGLLVGLGLGWLFATRPASAVALAVATTVVVGRRGWRGLGTASIGLIPGLWLWLAFQHEATGAWLGIAQRHYYAVSDGPPGCFRYGFGTGVGCLGEHGDFVRHNLAAGYGAFEALATTARRMKMHVSDALSFAPSVAFILLGMADLGRRPGHRGLAALPWLIVAAYAPFYFDGNYPGGGARLFAEAIGVEQVLAIVGVVKVAEKTGARATSETAPRHAPRLAALLVGLGLFGFAAYLEPDHAQLREREGGRPMYAPRRPPPADDLVFVGTDHGFMIARARRQRVARYKGDDHDWLVWDQLGRPRAWRYRHAFSPSERGGLELIDFPSSPPASLRVEAESLWPPRAQAQGWAWPSYVGAACASSDRVLELHPVADVARPMSATVALPPGLAGRALAPSLLHRDRGSVASLRLRADGRVLHDWTIPPADAGCSTLSPVALPPRGGPFTLEIEGERPPALDVLIATRKR